MQQRHLQQLSCRDIYVTTTDMQNFTYFILYMNIICNAQRLFVDNFEILHCSSAFAQRQKHFKQERLLSSKHVSIFLMRKYMT